MKTSTLLKYTLAFAAAILFFLPVQAQQKSDQNALYIFRNDGSFNAFFFADIERIEYSKIDTLGKEQIDYVVQEIYALDSIFRIPVSAIDSVAFVTPKNIVKADVVCPDKTMTDHIVASDSVSWFRLSSSAPSSVIPKVGDKVLIEKPVKYLPSGFSGKVTKVSNGSDGTTIETEAAALEELFDRLIVKAAAGSSASSGAKTRGVNAIDGAFECKEPIELPTVSGSATALNLNGDAISAFNDNFKISLDGSLALSYTVEPTITDFRAFFYADVVEGVKFYQYMKIDRKDKTSLTVSGTLGGNLDLPFTLKEATNAVLSNDRKTMTKKIGGFDVEMSYGWFFNGKATISGEIYNEKVGTSLITMSYDQPVFHIPQQEDFFYKSAYTNVSDTCAVSGWASGLSGSTGIYAKAGVKIGCLQRQIETEARLEAGVRLEENTAVKPGEIAKTDILERGSIFTTISKEGTASRYFYGGASFTVSLNLWKGVKWNPINFGLELTLSKQASYKYVPTMNSIKWEPDKKAPWRGTLTAPLGGNLLFAKKVGLAAFDMTDEKNPTQVYDFWKTVEYDSPKYYSELKELIESFETSRTYKAWPQVRVYEYPVIADQEVEIKLGDPMMDIKPKAVEFDENPGYKDIEVITNVKNTEFTTEAAWLNETKPTWNNEEGRLTVYAPELPDGTDSRKGYVIGVGYDKEGKELLRDTVTVTQLRPILQATPNPVQFEQKGGTVKVALNTTLTQIEAKIQEGGNLDKFFTMTLNSDNTITVTAPENTTGNELSGNIIVKGISPGGQKAELNLNVTQKSGAAEKPEMTLSTEKMTFDHNSGSMDFTVHVAGGVTLKTLKTSQKNDSSGKKWLDWVLKDKSDPNNRVYTVTVTANNDDEVRTGTIELTARNDDGSVEIVKTLTITQESVPEESDLKIDFVSFSMTPQKLVQQLNRNGNSYFDMTDNEAKIVKNGNRYTVTGNFAKKNNSTSGAMAPTEEFALSGDYMNTCDYKFTFYKDSQDGWYYLESADIKYHDHGESNFINYLHEGSMSMSNGKYYMQSPYGPDHNKYEICCEGVEMTGTSRIWQWFDEGSKYVKYDISVNDEVWSTTVWVEFK